MFILDEAQVRLEDYLQKKVEFLHFNTVTWNNGALGCPEPGGCYTQALVLGYEISFCCGDEIFSIHTDSRGRTFILCADPPIRLVNK